MERFCNTGRSNGADKTDYGVNGTLHYAGGEISVPQADERFLPYCIPDLSVEGIIRMVLCNPEGAHYEG